MNCAIIGSTKIAEVHAEQLIRNGIKEVTFISRSKIKGKKIIEKVKKKFSKNIFFSQSDLKVLKKKKFNIICICSSTEVHHQHLRFISGLKSTLIIEKPIVSLLELKNKYEIFLKGFYKKNKKVVVCYPYIYLAKNFKKFVNINKKLETVDFEFQTGGRSRFRKICINLMPHALSFFHSFFLDKSFLNNIYKKNNLVIQKYKWKVSFVVGTTAFNLIFKEKESKKTSLKLQLNKMKFARKTLKSKNKFINFLQDYQSKKKKIINNPMGEFYTEFFKNIDNSNYYKDNKKLTLSIMKKNYFLIN
jgi:hypothetical protein